MFIAANLLVVPPDVPAKTLPELVALARAQPGKLTYGHAGVGTSQHLGGELLKYLAHVDIQPVAYRGTTAVLPDLLAGRLTMSFANISNALPLVREGKLRTFAVSSRQRSAAAPDLPTMSESGYPGFEAVPWFGLMAPVGTPRAIIEKVHRETVRVLAMPDVQKSLRTLGLDLIGNSPEQFAAVIKAEDSAMGGGDQGRRDQGSRIASHRLPKTRAARGPRVCQSGRALLASPGVGCPKISWTGGVQMKMCRRGGRVIAMAFVASLSNSMVFPPVPRIWCRSCRAAATINWSGYYVGGNLGAGVGRTSFTVTMPGLSTSTSDEIRGFVGGGQGGFNWQFGSLGRRRRGGRSIFPPAQRRQRFRSAIHQHAGLVLHAARPARIRHGRVAVLRDRRRRICRQSGQRTASAILGWVLGIRTSFPLWVVGVGVETQIWDRWTGRLEYLYLAERLGLEHASPSRAARWRSPAAVHDNVIRTGLNYHF